MLRLWFSGIRNGTADAGLTPEKISSPKVGLIAGSGGASSAEQVIAADIARNKGVKRIGPYAVPKVMGSTVSAVLSTLLKIKGSKLFYLICLLN